MDDAVWNACGVLEPRPITDRRVAQRFFAKVNKQTKKFMSDEHVTIDQLEQA
jgi:hypothetical protein